MRKSTGGRPKGATVPLVDRFWKYVTKGYANACWLWEGGHGSEGHARIWDGRQSSPAHHVAWLLKHGSPVPRGHFCRRSCKNKKTCMNPAHLYLYKFKRTK